MRIKSIKKIIFLMVAFVTMFILPYQSYALDFQDMKVGDEISFGRYEERGEIKDLEWYILDIYDNKMLLFSKYIIDCMPYTEVNSYLKNIFEKHFTDEEKERAVFTENNIRIENIDERLEKGFVLDKIFILTNDDIVRYFHDENGEVKDKRVIGIGTKMAYEHGLNKMYIDDERKKYVSPYWVGEKGYEMGFFKAVSYNGKVIEDGYYKSRFDCGVRPAIVINIE